MRKLRLPLPPPPNMLWWQLVVRVAVSGGVIVGASELAKRFELLGAILISLPLMSIIAMIWLFNDTSNTEKVAEFATEIMWLVIPSLVLFFSLPIFLNRGMDFWPALGLASGLTIVAYAIGVGLVTKYASAA